jgi:mRNA-degrading endonuclease YafQ of YafQ-DinJ toxin-antitoxin module
MSALTIPEQYERGITNIKNLSDSDTDKVLQALKAAGPEAKSVEIVNSLGPMLKQLSEDDVNKLVEAIYSLYFLRAHSEVDIDEFVNDVAEAISESENKELRVSESNELTRLKTKFKALLSVQPISTHSKAHGLRTDFANIFWDAKIITDIRPIWDEDPKLPPDATVITNTLKLEYHHIGGHGELYVYLDKEDIEMLMSVLQRARDKIATLEFLATAKWMKILED